jgi:cytochrome c peroxidase
MLSTVDGRPLAVALPPLADPTRGREAYALPVPAYMTPPPMPPDNPLTHAGVDLGRSLFFDPLLSGSDTISCGSCHHQERSFADRRGVSVGESGVPLARNTMALVNLAWTAPYFWDGRAGTLEALVPQPIQHPDEMNEDMARLVGQLQAHPGYPARFEAAFPGEGISEATISKGIAQFLRTLVSFNSRADLIDTGRVELTPLEMRGNQIMTGGLPIDAPDRVPDICDACHQHNVGVTDAASEMGLFTTSEPKSNGLPDVAADPGIETLSGKPGDRGRFIVPSIRNLSVTAPYMHDGRFSDLDAVLQHYDDQMVASPALEEPLAKDGAPRRMNMSAEDRAAVVAMLGVFTDEHFLENPAFADPFSDTR